MRDMKTGSAAIVTTAVEMVRPGSVVVLEHFWPKGEVLHDELGRRFLVDQDTWQFGHSSIPAGMSGHAPVQFFFPLEGDEAPVQQMDKELDHA